MKGSLFSHAGYLEIDHRDSPGLTPEQVAHVPKAVPVGAGEHFEADVKQCAHCGSTVILNAKRERPRGYCQKCDHYICDNPICNKECAPLSKLLDNVQNRLVKQGPQPHEPLIQLTDL